MKTVLEYAPGNKTTTEFKITIEGNPRLSNDIRELIREWMIKETIYHEL